MTGAERRLVKSCRSCGAPVVWASTTAGGRMPVDPDPDPERGNLVLAQEPPGALLARVATGVELESLRAGGAALYLSHFATCPHAAEHRR